ncbi:hypothetical protein HDU97_010299 [Phlyctochytrium planicorne]|nr:hypothetical protein HDU97_010299 [Phlyctochytrium planicorne]
MGNDIHTPSGPPGPPGPPSAAKREPEFLKDRPTSQFETPVKPLPNPTAYISPSSDAIDNEEQADDFDEASDDLLFDSHAIYMQERTYGRRTPHSDSPEPTIHSMSEMSDSPAAVGSKVPLTPRSRRLRKRHRTSSSGDDSDDSNSSSYGGSTLNIVQRRKDNWPCRRKAVYPKRVSRFVNLAKAKDWVNEDGTLFPISSQNLVLYLEELSIGVSGGFMQISTAKGYIHSLKAYHETNVWEDPEVLDIIKTISRGGAKREVEKNRNGSEVFSLNKKGRKCDGDGAVDGSRGGQSSTPGPLSSIKEINRRKGQASALAKRGGGSKCSMKAGVEIIDLDGQEWTPPEVVFIDDDEDDTKNAKEIAAAPSQLAPKAHVVDHEFAKSAEPNLGSARASSFSEIPSDTLRSCNASIFDDEKLRKLYSASNMERRDDLILLCIASLCFWSCARLSDAVQEDSAANHPLTIRLEHVQEFSHNRQCTGFVISPPGSGHRKQLLTLHRQYGPLEKESLDGVDAMKVLRAAANGDCSVALWRRDDGTVVTRRWVLDELTKRTGFDGCEYGFRVGGLSFYLNEGRDLRWIKMMGSWESLKTLEDDIFADIGLTIAYGHGGGGQS